MTRWARDPGVGRPRGPVGLVRSWATILVRPHRFFASKVAPADQAPGITFLAAVVLVEESIRFALVEDAYVVVGGRPLQSAVLWLLVAVVLVAPAVVHLVAALQTLLLMATVEERAGVGETVQVLCYATAPCVLAGVPDARVRALCVGYGAVLYLVGLATVHGSGPVATLAAGALPATLVFGVGFRGIAALRAVAETASEYATALG